MHGPLARSWRLLSLYLIAHAYFGAWDQNSSLTMKESLLLQLKIHHQRLLVKQNQRWLTLIEAQDAQIWFFLFLTAGKLVNFPNVYYSNFGELLKANKMIVRWQIGLFKASKLVVFLKDQDLAK